MTSLSIYTEPGPRGIISSASCSKLMALSNLSVHRRAPVLVAPAEPTPHELKPLSDIDDQQSLRFHVPFIQYYKNDPSRCDDDPVAVIREALSKALVFYYPFAGRLREGEGKKLMVECTGEGVLFVEADANVTLEDFGEQLPPPLPWLKQLLCDVPGSDGITGCPLLLFQVTRLACGGFAVAVRLNHTMSDAQGIAQFLTAVSEIARGSSSPSLPPSWSRELLTARDPPSITQTHAEFDPFPHSPCTQFTTNQKLVERSFFLGPKQVSALKQQLPFPATSFEVISASVWRARAIALGLDPNEELRFMFNINVRSKLNPPLPPGYYGNVFVYPAIVTTSGQLCKSPLSYAVELVKQAKAKATDEYMRSFADLMAVRGRPPFCMTGVQSVYFVSDNTKTGYAEIDYGWGKAEYGGPMAVGFDSMPGVLSFYVAFRNDLGERGTVVPMCLPEDAMERFAAEIESLVLPPTVEIESPVTVIQSFSEVRVQ